MSFPNTVAATPPNFVQGSGPYNIGNVRYAPMEDSAATKINMWHSTDAGVTWTKLDTAHAPTLSTTEPIGSVTDGTNIYVVYNSGNFVAVTPFNTSTGLWGTPTVTTVEKLVDDEFCGVAFRASDLKLVIAGGFASLAQGGHKRCGYFLFDTVALTNNALTRIGGTNAGDTNDWILFGTSKDAKGFTWFLFYDGTPNATRNLVSQSLADAANVLGTLQTVDTITKAASDSTFISLACDGNNLLAVWWPDDTANKASMFESPSGNGGVASWGARQTATIPNSGTFIDAMYGAIISPGVYVVVMASDDGVNMTINYFLDFGSGFQPQTPFGFGTLGVGVFSTNFIVAQPIAPGKFGFLMGANSDAFYWEFSPAFSTRPPINVGAVMILPDASKGVLCRFGRVSRCRDGSSIVVNSKVLVRMP